MERQLKERLIGAGVLVAIAVLLVPEMFSGPKSRDTPVVQLDSRQGSSDATTDQVKTWQVDLQRAPASASLSSEAAEPAVEQPAAAPVSDARSSASSLLQASAAVSSSRSAASSASSASSAAASVASAARSSRAASSSASASTPAPTPAPPAPKPEVAGTWQVQLGSFGTEAKARDIATKLKAQGYRPSVSALKAGGKTLYRVRVAGGASRDAAQALLKKLSATYDGAALVAPGK